MHNNTTKGVFLRNPNNYLKVVFFLSNIYNNLKKGIKHMKTTSIDNINYNQTNPQQEVQHSKKRKYTHFIFSSDTSALPIRMEILSKNPEDRPTTKKTKLDISEDVWSSIVQRLDDSQALELAANEKNPNLFFFNRKSIQIKDWNSSFNFIRLLALPTYNSQYSQNNQIQSIDLSLFKDIRNETVRNLIDGCPLLQTINLKHCKLVREATIKHMADKCPRLQTINLNFCNQVTDKTIIYLADKWPFLHTIYLSYCNKITDKATIYLADKCPLLRLIHLIGCPQVTDNAAIYLADKYPRIIIIR